LPHKQPLKREKSDEPAASNYPFVSKEPEVITLGTCAYRFILLSMANGFFFAKE